MAAGRTSIDVALRFVNASVWTRLHYLLTPDRSDGRAFAPSGGIVALSPIASHVFEIKTTYAGVPRRGSPFTIHAQAMHPVTRLPVPVSWEATLATDDQEIAPAKTSTSVEGFMELVFDLPDAPERP